MEKLTRTDSLEFGNGQDGFVHFSWFKCDSHYLDLKLKASKKHSKKECRLVQNLTMGEADFKQFMRLRNQLVNAAANFAREEHLTPVLIPTMPKDMDEPLNLALRVIDIVDRATKKIRVTLLQYSVDKPESFRVRVRIIARQREDKKFLQTVYIS